MLAVIGVAAMISFVFLDPRILGFGRQGKSEDPIAVETAYGAIRDSELHRMRYTREMLRRFIGSVVEVRFEEELKEQYPAAPEASIKQDAIALANMNLPQVEQRIFGQRYPQSEAAAIQTMIMARKAEQMGMVVSDKAVNDLIRQLLGDAASKKVDSAKVARIIASLRDDRWALGEAGFFNAMRDEILAQHLTVMFSMSLGTIPPQQEFEYFVRLNRNAIVEIAPLNVAEFTKDAPEPTENELKDMFDHHKNQVPNPDSPDPGFKVPRKVQVEYFKIERSPFIEAAKEGVTDEEIKEYYEKNKTPMFRINPPEKDRKKPFSEETDAGDESTGTDDEMPENDKADGDKADSDTGADKAPDDKASESPKSDAESTDDGVDSQDKAKEAPAAKSGNPGAETPATDEKGADPKKPATTPKQPPADKKKSNNKDGKSVSKTQPTLRLISGDNSATRPRVPIGQAKAENEEEKAEAPDNDAPKSDSATTDQAAPREDGLDSDSSQPAEDGGNDSPKGDPPKFKPLDEVREEIVNVIARTKGIQAYQDAIAALQRKMNDYTSAVVLHNAGQVADPPKKLDLEALAKEFDVSYSIFDEPLSAVDAERKTDIGKSYVLQRVGEFERQKLPFVNLVYRDEMGLYKSQTTEGADNVTYLFWKTVDNKEEAPSFEQARKRVTATWKMERARDLALKRAETYADEARKAKQPLKTVFGGAPPKLDVEKTLPFTWLTEGSVPLRMGGQPQLSEVDKVEQAGVDFLRSVFSLPEGGVAVVMNQPKTMVYVVRMDDLSPPLKELETKFAHSVTSQNLALVADEEKREVAAIWRAQIDSEAKVQWQRPERASRQ